jgi:hypothetical protein
MLRAWTKTIDRSIKRTEDEIHLLHTSRAYKALIRDTLHNGASMTGYRNDEVEILETLQEARILAKLQDGDNGKRINTRSGNDYGDVQQT